MLTWTMTDNLWVDTSQIIPKADCAEWAEAPHVPHPPGTVAGCLQQPWHSMGFLTPRTGILHSNSPNYSLAHQSPFKWTPGSKITLSSVCVAMEAHPKSRNRRNSCTEPGTFKCPSTEHDSHSVHGTNWQLPMYLPVRLWHSATDKLLPMLTNTHTPKKKKKSTATTSSLPFHQSNNKVDCPYQMLAGSRHYINLVKYNYEINKIIKDGLLTLKGIVSLWNISSERNLEMHLLLSCQLLIYSGFSSIFLQRNVKRSVIFF